MKVAFILQDMFARGAQYVTARMVQGFVMRGYDVDLIVSQYHNKFLLEGQTNFFTVPKKANWIFLKNLRARDNIFEIRHYLKTTDSEVLFSMSTGYTHAMRIATIGLHKRIKLVHVEHFFAGYDDFGQRKCSPGMFTPRGLISRWYWSAFDRIFTVTSAGSDDFARMNPWYPRKNIRVVNNPAIDSEFSVRATKQSSHPWLVDDSADWKTFISAGAFVPSKGYMFLFEAMKCLAKRGERIRLIVFGEGAQEVEYRRFVTDENLGNYISFGGYTANLPAEASKAHGYISTSLVESFGITLVEALAAGCRVVAFDAPFGPREILADGKYGKLVPTGDVLALTDAIVDVSKEERIPCPPDAWRRYTVEATVDRYLKGIE